MTRTASPPCRLVVLALIFTFLLAPPVMAATILSLGINQLSYRDMETGSIRFASEFAEFRVLYETGPTPQFLNVQAVVPGAGSSPVWIVRNLYLRDASNEPPTETLSEQFFLDELGVPPGTEVSEIQIGFSLSDTVLVDSFFDEWSVQVPLDQVLPVRQEVVTQGTRSPHPEAPTVPGTPPRHAPQAGPPSVVVYADQGCQVPNLDLDSKGSTGNEAWNGCVPAACANSLHWLRSKHPEINFSSTLQQTFSQLSRLMNRNPDSTGTYQGVAAPDAARAKMDFAEAYGLPIRVKYQDFFNWGDVKSTSGVYTAGDSSAAPGSYPTKEWIAREAAKGEDVEVNVSWIYTDSLGHKKWDGAHAVTLTGLGETAGRTWIRWKDDKDQSRVAPDSLRHGNSDVIPFGGALHIPGLDRWCWDKVTGHWYVGTAYITSVVSESYDIYVHAPSAGKYFDNYCKSVKRTIPANGGFEVTYPEDTSRPFAAQVYILDRTRTPPRKKLVRGWYGNGGRKRTYHNPHPYPVTVELHNDDHAGTTTPYPGFTVNLRVIPGWNSKAAIVDDPSNWEEFGGFSLGVDDSLSSEFSPVDLGAVVDVGPIVDGFTLDQVPAHLGAVGGTQELWVRTDIPVFNPAWEHLGLLVDVATLNQPGDLLFECPGTGTNGLITISAPGRYEVDLGIMAPQPQFELRLVAQNGLDMYLDCLGVPSLVEGVPVDAPPVAAPQRAVLSPNHPNPFNPRTTIRFGLPHDGEITLAIYDLRGRMVRTLFEGFHGRGTFRVVWDGRDDRGRPVVSGSYLCRLKTGKETLSRKMTLVR